MHCTAEDLSPLPWSRVQYSGAQFPADCSILQYSTVQYSTVIYCTLQYIRVYCMVLRDSSVVLSREHYSSVRNSLQKLLSSFVSIICPNTQQYYSTPLLLHALEHSCISVPHHYSTPVLLR